MATPLENQKGLKSSILKYVATPMFCAASLLFNYEGVSQTPYKDSGGITTVCVGSTAQGPGHAPIIPHKVYTPQECAKRLEADLGPTYQHVVKSIKVPITDGEKAAYVSFTYNVGVNAWDGSSALKLLNGGNHVAACRSLTNWVFVGRTRVQGLVRRREAERDMCLGKVTTQ